MKPISATSGLGHPHSPPYPARALSSRAFGPRPSFRPFHSRRIILGLRPIRSLDAHRFVWSLARHNTTPRLPGRRVLSLHYAYSPGPSIYSPQRLHPCGLSRPCDLAYQHTYLHYRCSAHATPEPSCRTRAPLDLGSAPQAPIISYIRPPLSLSQEARRDDPRHTLADNTHIRAALRPPVTPLYTLYLFLPCLFLRAACGVPSVSARCCPITLRIRSLLQPSAPRRMAPYTTVVRSLEYNRCPSPPQRCPYPRTTTALPRPIHPSTRHNTLLLALRPSHRSSHLLFARHSATRHFTLRTALRLFARPLFALLHLFSTSMAPLS
jgi:hypothetical protein